ncbi:hypothetical protein ACFRH6_26860 [Streptomyces sp. NPDC056749]|uniref:hypothetical protein n=1 Tax=Streptomyces sp. NPDC056749 TaxID=3345936 RepID=UPI00369830FB
MVGRNGRSRIPAEEAEEAEGSAAGGAPGDSTADTPHATDAPAGAPGHAPDTLTGLLAVLGGHLEGHAPDEVVVLLRDELERRELRAYSSGWRDAATHYEPALQEARAAGGRALRLVRGVPGQAAVIPLRQQGRDAADRSADGRSREGEAADGRTGRSAPAADGERGERADRPQAPAPALVPKSRSSRVPTIPRLRPPPRRPAEDGAPVTPDGESV